MTEDASPGDLRQLLARQETEFRDAAPLSATAAATTILEGVKAGDWRILLGEDAAALTRQSVPSPRPPTTTPP